MSVFYTALDFETTGIVKGYDNLPWQLGAITLKGGRVDLTSPFIDTYLHVPETHPFSKHAPGTFRTHRAEIAEAPAFATVWQQLHSQLSSTIPVAHNASTERKILSTFAPLTAYPLWVDTLRLARYIWRGLPSYALDDLIPQLGLLPRLVSMLPDRAPHDAFYDAIACGLLLEYILALPGWSAATPQDLASI